MLRRNSKKKWKAYLSGRGVLLVEDNELNQEIAKMLLEDEKMVVTTAETARKLWILFPNQFQADFDFIFMDIMMPVMDGFRSSQTDKDIEP